MMPETVAIIGASNDRSKYGNKAVRAYRRAGYEVYPIHPRERWIEGVRAYPDLASVPGPVDRVALYVPSRIGVTLLEQIAACHPKEFFVNPGSESHELLEKAGQLGLEPIQACAILTIGEDPNQLDDPPPAGEAPGDEPR